MYIPFKHSHICAYTYTHQNTMHNTYITNIHTNYHIRTNTDGYTPHICIHICIHTDTHMCISTTYVTETAKIDLVGTFKYLRNNNLKYSMPHNSPVPDSNHVRFTLEVQQGNSYTSK